VSRPRSMKEWSEYIGALAGGPLYSQAVAANTIDFGRALLEEGITMGEVEQIIMLFVRRLRITGTKVPRGGPYNMINMALTDPVAMAGATMSEIDADFVEGTVQPLASDDFDMFDMEASLDL